MQGNLYKLMPFPFIFTVGDVQLVHVIMGETRAICESLDCLDSALSVLPADAYFAPLLSEALCIVDTFCGATFSAEEVVCKNMMAIEACKEMFEFYQHDDLGLLAVAAYVSSDESWSDFFKLVKRMCCVRDADGNRRATGMVLMGDITTAAWKAARDSAAAAAAAAAAHSASAAMIENGTRCSDDDVLPDDIEDYAAEAERLFLGIFEQGSRHGTAADGRHGEGDDGRCDTLCGGEGEEGEEEEDEDALWGDEDMDEEDIGEPMTKEEIINMRLDEISNYISQINAE